MKCPYCHSSDDSVVDSRPLESASIIRRRRICKSCAKRFTTYERLEEMPLMVVKSDNRREPYDRNKLREGLLRACMKRPISIDTIDLVLAEVEYELKDYVMEIPSRVIGEKVLQKLYAIDQVAYVRFASVYRNFSDIDSFLSEIHKIKSRKKKSSPPADPHTEAHSPESAEIKAVESDIFHDAAKNQANLVTPNSST